MKTLVQMVVVGMLACSLASPGQSPSAIAALSIKAPEKTYHMGEVPVLDITIKNVSKGSICFEISPRGSFDVEVYDLQDPSGKDLGRPIREKKNRIVPETMTACHQIAPGDSWKLSLNLDTMPALVTHPGLYKIVVSRHEVVNDIVIVGNPVTIEFVQ